LIPEQGMLFVLDGSKALKKGVRSVFGEVPVQRCLWHKERNVMGHLPERDRPPIKARMRRAWREADYPRALEQLRWTAAGMLEAEKQFRKVIGYTDLPHLAVAIERRLHLPQPNPLTTQEAAIAVTL
jgi:hypothetical protein